MSRPPESGAAIYALIEELFPICRSITGDGVRETLRSVSRHLPLDIHEVPTGTQVYDWTIPKEWNIRTAYIRDPHGQTVVDFADNNLHVMSYSVPVEARMPLSALKKRIFTLPEYPEFIPYRTSYYSEDWAFCMSHRQLESLSEGEYEVCIDSSLEAGSLTYGETIIPGDEDDEVLFFSHVCHPSMCNDNLSGIGVLTFLGRWLKSSSRRYSYRIVFAPGTIGSLAWLAGNQGGQANIKHGLIASLLGDGGTMTYKRTRYGNAEIDRVVCRVLDESGVDHEIREFVPWGYDERQFCSPGINLPVGRLTRTPNGEFAEYHTSADNLDFVRPEYLSDSLDIYKSVVETLEGNGTYLNQSPYGEPQLGRRGLYKNIGGYKDIEAERLALLWILNFSDGKHSLLDISERASMEFAVIRRAADTLLDCGLLGPVD